MKRIVNDLKCVDKSLLFFTILLSGFSIINIVTASSREAVVNLDQSIFYFFSRDIIIYGLGFVAYIVLLFIDSKYYKIIFIPLLFLFIFLNCLTIISGKVTRGALNWIPLGGFNLQPSEFSKPIIIVILALMCERFCRAFRKEDGMKWNRIFMFIGIGLIYPGLVFIQKDLGTATVLLGIFGVIYLSSPITTKDKAKSVGIVLVFLLFAASVLYIAKGYILSDAQKSRFNFVAPCKNYANEGYQVCNAFISINLGGALGVGPGKSTQKYSYIPEPHTDMVFAIVAEEFGMFVGLFILFIYGFMIWKILLLSVKASTIRGKYICLGVGTYIFLHIFINLGGLFGLIPLTGIPLPFLTYGGSFTISLLVALGLVQRVNIETKQYRIVF